MPMIVFLVALAIGATPGPQRYPDAWRDCLGAKRMVRDEVVPSLQQTAFPDTLILLGTYATSGKARDVWVKYPYAYLANDWLGVEVIDISDPTNPTWIRTIDTPGQAYDVQVKDTLVYVADDYSGFQILNKFGLISGYDTPRICRGVFTYDTLAYLSDYASLFVLDVSDAGNPVPVGRLELDSEKGGIFVVFPRAYVCGYAIMWIVDIVDPTSPQWIGLYIDPDYYFYPYNVYVRNSLAYVANYYDELFIIDVSNPANPVRVGIACPPDELWGFAWDIKLQGDYAYVANYDGGLWVADVSDPAHPKNVAVYNTPGLAGGVFVDSDYVYVADYYSLLVFEQSPKGVGEWGLGSRSKSLRLFQNDPNPFGKSTAIRYELPNPARVSLRVYDSAGRLTRVLVDEEEAAGAHLTLWDGRDEQGREAPAGVYFYRLEVGLVGEVKKMVLLR